MSDTSLPFARPRPPDLRSRGIDLRCCDVAKLLRDLDEPADLVIADPPWSYSQRHGATAASDVYAGLPMSTIREHVERAVGGRLALWCTWPLLGEWMTQPLDSWGSPVTGGAWSKSSDANNGHYGQGYHWAGCSELVLVYTKSGSYTDRDVPLRNAWTEPPGLHSRKPVAWQTDWIRRWVPPGGLVLDLYAGLGSVAEATMRAGERRRYIGAELDAERHASALALLAQVRA